MLIYICIVCVWYAVVGHMSQGPCESQKTILCSQFSPPCPLSLPLPLSNGWVQGIELGSLGICSKCFQPASLFFKMFFNSFIFLIWKSFEMLEMAQAFLQWNSLRAPYCKAFS